MSQFNRISGLQSGAGEDARKIAMALLIGCHACGKRLINYSRDSRCAHFAAHAMYCQHLNNGQGALAIYPFPVCARCARAARKN